MQQAIIVIFLVLFIGRMTVRFVLHRLNMKNLKLHGREIPALFEGEIDAATLDKMVAYGCDQAELEAKENLAGDIVELAVLFGLLPYLAGVLSGTGLHLIWQALAFFAVLAAISGLVSLPFDIYHTFVLELKHGFSTITWKLWLADLARSLVISALLMAVLVSALMAFIIYLPATWWLWGWAFFTAFQIVLLWLYPVLIAPLFNKFEPVADTVLAEKITAMAKKAGLQTSGVFQVDQGKRSRHTNAYFTGLGRTKRIVLYDTLLSSHAHEEIMAVLAHEIGHWKKKHIAKQLAFMICASLVLFYVVFLAVAWPPLYQAFGIAGTPVYAGFFLVSLYLSAGWFFLSPLAAALSRRFERDADTAAVALSGSPQPLVSALKRLAKDNLSNLHPHPWYVAFYYSHPPLARRIEYLLSLDYK